MKYLENGFCVEIYALDTPNCHRILREYQLHSIVYNTLTDALEAVKRVIKRDEKLDIVNWTYDKEENEFVGKIDDKRSVHAEIVKSTKRNPITKEIDKALSEVNLPPYRPKKLKAPKLKTINYDTMDKPKKKRVRKPKPAKRQFYSPLRNKWWS